MEDTESHQELSQIKSFAPSYVEEPVYRPTTMPRDENDEDFEYEDSSDIFVNFIGRCLNGTGPQIFSLSVALGLLMSGLLFLVVAFSKWVDEEKMRGSGIVYENQETIPIGLLATGILLFILGVVALFVYAKLIDCRAKLLNRLRRGRVEKSLEEQRLEQERANRNVMELRQLRVLKLMTDEDLPTTAVAAAAAYNEQVETQV